ncbi:hypothetical protein JJC03_09240 [Flavobacterium oreochromis]|uniref:hypothetical protein n=1 Tax=Flavobacterium oreochromis TaxID=2906078 RepID=UPI001CE52F00|nr:hypothetical protein [Flavobacterium oreochromis]QYS85422.1 hypothetical protein JJC03_09240 [Flavobacterium oreochromis]
MTILTFIPETDLDLTFAAGTLNKANINYVFNSHKNAILITCDDEQTAHVEGLIMSGANGKLVEKNTDYLLGAEVIICRNLTSDPYNKKGGTGKIIGYSDDKHMELSTYKIQFLDGVVGLYQYGTFK